MGTMRFSWEGWLAGDTTFNGVSPAGGGTDSILTQFRGEVIPKLRRWRDMHRRLPDTPSRGCLLCLQAGTRNGLRLHVGHQYQLQG
jgi:hypothetical protein